ncbi:uncharacterized protein LOC115882741 [Sitophilus oryzae]|uniref:Non-homologous end-joining factor 1 n=1 Tax=Sitophilus oryzae TaxID=7048 RepID=A0A6J2XZE4_SITOR|nr:uncharacterized protein LOC115882741 [Sitophilus oryzae]XP_030756827.1 uncharacterized protein LOC115882741 [Sitophilus oryzae]
MWKPFKTPEAIYMLRLDEQDENFNLILTNITDIWETHFSLEQLVEIFKKENPNIEATEDIVKTNLLSTIEELGNVNISLNYSDNELNLVLQPKCSDESLKLGVPNIVYTFSLLKQDSSKFKNELTIPLIQTVFFLEKQQQVLLNLLKKKDRELEEYRMEKGDISRNDLKTETFHLEGGNNSNNLFLKVFKEGDEFWKYFTDQHGKVEIDLLDVEPEPWNKNKRRKVIHNAKTAPKKGIQYKK